MSYKFKVLSIDGGGIRGIIPAIILAEIENHTGKPISELFDLIAGTSTGGILALGLTKPDPGNPQKPHYTGKQLIDLYRNRGEEIFFEPWLERLTIVDDIVRPRYASDGRDKVLEEYLGETPIKDALTEVFITSYGIELRAPIFFTSKPNKMETHSRYFRKICNGFTMKQAAMATSAAPTYFKPYKVHTTQTDNGYYALVDGGVFANNPTSLAVMEAIIDAKKAGKKLDLEEILVVSLGTGLLTRRYPYDKAKNWGLLGWVQPLLNITLDGSSESVAAQLEQLLPKTHNHPPQYYRFQASLDKGKGSDDLDNVSPENISQLEALARQIINERDSDLIELCNQLLQPKTEHIDPGLVLR